MPTAFPSSVPVQPKTLLSGELAMSLCFSSPIAKIFARGSTGDMDVRV